jgi:dGTPase
MREEAMKNKDAIRSEITSNNLKREKDTLATYACKSTEGKRKDPKREKVPDGKNIRPVFSHDTDKIIHSLAYTRYIDKTQAFYLFKSDHITHRVLHVQLVSKIGRVIGRCLKLNEDLIEAIALGHDLGHVPYGHDGERILNDICKKNEMGCFCHNAQSVRLLMEVEEKGKGLNLSLQVLDGILAHNGERPRKKYKPNYGKTWQVFEEEYKKCFAIENYSDSIMPMTLEGCVVRISDVIAYIGRDIEDARRLKVIKRNDVPIEIRRILGSSNDRIVNTLVLDLVRNSHNKPYLAFSEDICKALDDLLQFNIKSIYTNPVINTQAKKIEDMYEQLFQRYSQDLENNAKDTLIYKFVHKMNTKYLKNTNTKRRVIDYIAGMTDDFFYNQYQELFVPQSYGYKLKPRKKPGKSETLPQKVAK